MENTLTSKTQSWKLFLHVCLSKQEPLNFPSGSLKDLNVYGSKLLTRFLKFTFLFVIVRVKPFSLGKSNSCILAL